MGFGLRYPFAKRLGGYHSLEKSSVFLRHVVYGFLHGLFSEGSDGVLDVIVFLILEWFGL
jgi:hypothetical protein